MLTGHKNAFSVIVPFYETDLKQMRQCLESVLRQNREMLGAIIVVNDGSGQESTAGLRRLVSGLEANVPLPERLIDLVELPENAGLAAARKAGYERCRTPFVIFADSDDFYNRDDVLQIAAGHFRKYPEAAFVMNGSTYVNSRGRVVSVKNSGTSAPRVETFDSSWYLRAYPSLDRTLFPVWQYVFRREAISEPRFWNALRLPQEDSYFFVNLLKSKAKAVITADAYYSYRANTRASIMSKVRRGGALAHLKNIQKWLTSFPGCNVEVDLDCKRVWLLMCCVAVMQEGYPSCAKNVPAFPARAELSALNREFGFYSGLKGKWFRAVLAGGLRGSLLVAG